MTTQQITTIPLSKLTASEDNVRKTDRGQGIDELAASIAAHGLLQPLVVRKAKRGKFDVIAGGRRLAALQLLRDEKRIEAGHDIPCMVRDDNGLDLEVSLAENVVRAPMHPADQYEAFSAIIDAGASVPEVAARFGMAESTVAKRLKLGKLSPVILTAYREEKLDLEQAMAFTLSDDHATQDQLFAEIDGRYFPASRIREALTQGEVPASDKRAVFVGLEAYEQAGGKVRRDLFDDDNSGYLQDPVLLDTLVADKLRSLEPEIKAEGWAWTQIVPQIGYDDLSAFKRLYAETLPLPEDQQAEYDALQAEYNKLEETDDDDDTDQDAIWNRMGEIEERMDELDNGRAEAWTQEQLAVAGTIITLGHDGMPKIHYGMVRPEDQKAAKQVEASAPSGSKAQKQKPAFAAALTEQLTAQRTAALTAELMRSPDIALAALVHAYAGRTFFHSYDSCLGVSATPSHPASAIEKVESENKALSATEASRHRLAALLPENQEDLWQWCLDQKQKLLLEVLAFCVARTVDVTERKNPQSITPNLDHAAQLSAALHLDMKGWFIATPANYFGKVSKNQILQAYREAKGHDVAPAWLKLKKGELAERVAESLKDTGWLPQPLRGEAPDAVLPAEDEPQDATNDNAPEDGAVLEAAE